MKHYGTPVGLFWDTVTIGRGNSSHSMDECGKWPTGGPSAAAKDNLNDFSGVLKLTQLVKANSQVHGSGIKFCTRGDLCRGCMFGNHFEMNWSISIVSWCYFTFMMSNVRWLFSKSFGMLISYKDRGKQQKKNALIFNYIHEAWG